jgi:hypothetical protein
MALYIRAVRLSLPPFGLSLSKPLPLGSVGAARFSLASAPGGRDRAAYPLAQVVLLAHHVAGATTMA